jgi:hypothetical protein
MQEAREFLEHHLQGIFANDISAYRASTVPDLTIYEWYVTPQRIEGLSFHEFMLEETGREDNPGMPLDPQDEAGQGRGGTRQRFDLANYREQRYGDTVICTYTLLISRSSATGVNVLSVNETRVLVAFEGKWRVVHVHKSPSWKAPFQAPA